MRSRARPAHPNARPSLRPKLHSRIVMRISPNTVFVDYLFEVGRRRRSGNDIVESPQGGNPDVLFEEKWQSVNPGHDSLFPELGALKNYSVSGHRGS